jgi:hypothetical protein
VPEEHQQTEADEPEKDEIHTAIVVAAITRSMG